MSRIVPLDPAEATGRPKELLEAVQANLGTTPNMMKVMARSAVLKAYLNLSAALSKGTVRQGTGEQIALGVADSNECGYCLSAHTYLGEHVAKLSGDDLEHGRQFQADDPKAAAIPGFAHAVIAGACKVSDDAFQAARNAGLSDAELADTVGHVAVNVLTNYFNEAFQVDIDLPSRPAAPSGRLKIGEDAVPSPTDIRPPFTAETATAKVQAAEDAWNTRDPDRVVLAYTGDSEWRNRDEFLSGREEIRAFLQRKRARENGYRRKKSLWAFSENQIAVRFEYESRDANGQWWCSYRNENWEFSETGLMAKRYSSINDVKIDAGERRIAVD